MSTAPPVADLLIVTAADERYGRCLHQFLANLQRRGLADRHPVIAYDLGLHTATLAQCQRRFPWCEFRRFPFERHPAHFALADDLEQELYAWKPTVIAEVATAATGLVLWCDSATLFHVDRLDFLVRLIQERGVFALRMQPTVGRRCNPEVCDRLGFPQRLLDGREYSASLCGFDPGRPAVRSLLTRWAEAARDRRNLERVFFGTGTHNTDQAVLCLLLHDAAQAGAITLGTEDADLSCAHPIRWASTRNKVRPGVPLWLDPLVCVWHRIYKLGDQFLWRMKERPSDR